MNEIPKKPIIPSEANEGNKSDPADNLLANNDSVRSKPPKPEDKPFDIFINDFSLVFSVFTLELMTNKDDSSISDH